MNALLRTYGLLTAILMASAALIVLWQLPTSYRYRNFRDPVYLAPPENIDQFHFGFRESMADSFWLRWIQDSEVCQVQGGAKLLFPGKDALSRFSVPRHRICDRSWGYLMLDVITRLAPKFKMPYLAGAIALSVLVEDYKGATLLFERGLQNYPRDWLIAYRAAYHYMFDLQNNRRAAELLVIAQANGGPYWLSSLAARLYSKAGQLELGIITLENYKKGLINPAQIHDVNKRIEEMKSALTRSK